MKKIISLLTIILVFQSCSDPDNTIYDVLDNYQKGAVLRTISTSGDYNFYDQSNSVFTATIEAHDEENGALLSNVEIFISADSGEEVQLRTLDASEFVNGPTDLPRTTFSVSLSEVNSKISYIGGSTVQIRLKLNLTNGRSFSTEAVTGSMTGSYFKSPYAYNKIILCNVTDGSAVPGIYTINMIDTYGDGWQDSVIKLTLDDTEYLYAMPSPYGSGVALNATLEAYTGNNDSGFGKITIPASASTMKWEWIEGRYPDETNYTIKYTKLDGSRPQNAFVQASHGTAGNNAANIGEKILSICQ
tara:strand:+ start:870 stop:1775 length:906 start_codon:yes stop_codon:yes gene_type:complete